MNNKHLVIKKHDLTNPKVTEKTNLAFKKIKVIYAFQVQQMKRRGRKLIREIL